MMRRNSIPVWLLPVCLSAYCLQRGQFKVSPLAEIEMYSNPGSIGLDPKLPLTSREKNLKRIPT